MPILKSVARSTFGEGSFGLGRIGNKWIALAPAYTGDVYTSTDAGENWASSFGMGGSYWWFLASSGTRCFTRAISQDIISWTDDGEYWFDVAVPAYYGNDYGYPLWDGTRFCFCDHVRFFTSPDAITWSSVVHGYGASPRQLVWTGSLYVQACFSGGVLTSPNGVVWTQNLMGNFQGWALAWNGKLLLMSGQGATTRGKYVTSFDGLVWTERDFPPGLTSGVYAAAAHRSGVFLVVTSGVGTEKAIGLSLDGITWEVTSLATVPDITNEERFEAVGFQGNKFVVTGYSITTPASSGFLYGEINVGFWTSLLNCEET